MKNRIVMGLLLCLLPATPLFAARTILYYENECCRNITEGEFAILYAQGLKLREPAQGWTVQSAAGALTARGHQPEKGWVLSRFLSEGVMSGLLRNSPFYRSPFDSTQFQNSIALVTVARARSVFPAEDKITQGEFAVLLAQALQLATPRGGWSPENAVRALESQSVPVKPVKGWDVTAPLREAEMMQILAPTAYRPAAIDPGLDISPMQAYSLLFGKFEVATEGHFGVFLAKSLDAPVPAGGWTKQAALDFIKSEFGVDSGYGWNPNAPLCVQTFENALRKILLQLKSGTTVTTTAAAKSGPSQPRNKEVESFLTDLRRNGLIPGDPCATISVQALVVIGAPLGRSDPPPPASSFVPPME